MAENDYTGPVDVLSPLEEPKSQVQEGDGSPKQDNEGLRDLQMVLALYKRYKKAREKYDKDWDKYEKYYNGEQWVKNKRPQYRAMPVANVCYPTVETVVPIMTDTSPGFEVVAQEPSDYEFADMLSTTREDWWGRSNMGHVLVEALEDACRIGVGVLKVVWDPDALEGRGDVVVSVKDPRNIFVPPDAEDFNRKCCAVIERYTTTLGKARRRWPDKAEKLRATAQNQEKTGNKHDTEIVVVSPIDKNENLTQPDYLGMGGGEDQKEITILECWLDDYTEEEYELETENGQKKTGTRMKFPRGKLVWVVEELKLHLETADNPYYDGRKPYVRMVDNLVPRQFYAKGEIEPLEHTQDNINQVFAKIMDWMNMCTNPVWIIDIESDVDPGMITNQVGAIIPKRQGTAVDRKDAPPIPSQVFELLHLLQSHADTVTGVHDITQGRKPPGITAGKAMDTLQEASQTRIRLKERNMQVSLQQLGYLWVSRILQFYTSPRFVKLTGKKGIPEYFEFYVKDTEDGGKKPISRKFSYDEVGNQYVPDARGWVEGVPSKGMFDIRVIAGTALPYVRAQRNRLALDLFNVGAIDHKALLDTMEWKDKEQILNRMAKAQGGMTQGKPQPGQPSPPAPGVK